MVDEVWLTLDQQQAWRAHLHATQRLFAELDRQLQRDAGFPRSEYEILVRLSEAPGWRLRMSELACSMYFSPSRLSHAVARLERAGDVRRETVAGEGRRTEAVLTEHGHATPVAAAPGHVAAVREHLVDKLTGAQLGQLHEISRALLSDRTPRLEVASTPRRTRVSAAPCARRCGTGRC